MVPPKIAALETGSAPDLSGWRVPPMWACGSMPPGATIMPAASIIRLAVKPSAPGSVTAAMVSPEMWTSISLAPDGVTTVPPEMVMSSMIPSL